MQQHKQQDGRPTLRLQRRFCSADRCATLLCSMCTPTLTPSPSPSSRPNGGGDDWKDCNNQLPITAMQHSPSQSPDQIITHSHMSSLSHTVTCLVHHTITCLAHHKINCLVDHKITSLVHHTATCLVHHTATCLARQSLDQFTTVTRLVHHSHLSSSSLEFLTASSPWWSAEVYATSSV